MEEQDRKKKLFEEHLPYELDMFEEAAKFLMSKEFANLNRKNNKDDWFRANAAIEAFWTHARTLEKFFTQRKNPEPVQDRITPLPKTLPLIIGTISISIRS
jgi:hypothetical protein